MLSFYVVVCVGGRGADGLWEALRRIKLHCSLAGRDLNRQSSVGRRWVEWCQGETWCLCGNYPLQKVRFKFLWLVLVKESAKTLNLNPGPAAWCVTVRGFGVSFTVHLKNGSVDHRVLYGWHEKMAGTKWVSTSFFPPLYIMVPRRWIYWVSATSWNLFGICLFSGFFR